MKNQAQIYYIAQTVFTSPPPKRNKNKTKERKKNHSPNFSPHSMFRRQIHKEKSATGMKKSLIMEKEEKRTN